MNVWVFLGSLFILVCVCTVVYAICKFVSIVDETRDRTNTLARIALKDGKRISGLDGDLSNLAEKIKLLNDYRNVTDQTVSEDRAEISALHDHFDDLLKRIENLEKGGAQIERETGHTGKKC